jgi:hypothetical protein
MADKRTRSEHFLWQQQRLREDSDRKHAASIRNDREFDYNRRDGAGSRSQASNQAANAELMGSLAPLIWFLAKWFIAYALWSILVGMVNGPTTVLGIFITVVFIGLTVLKQVRRFRKRYL